MATVLRMPGVSADATEAALMEWAVSPGATVKRGDVVASVETDKAVVDLEAEDDGILLKTFAEAGESVPIGDPIAVFVQPGEDTSDEASIFAAVGLGPQSSGPLSAAEEEQSQDLLVPGGTPNIEHTADEVVESSDGSEGIDGSEGTDISQLTDISQGTDDSQGTDGRWRLFASPLARRLAAEAGLPLKDLEGSGPNGRIRRRDVEQALARKEDGSQAREERPAPEPEAAESPTVPVQAPPATAGAPAKPGSDYAEIPHSRVRRAIAGALTGSKQNVPHFYVKATCRVDALLELRARVNADAGVKISINDFIVKAVALAMVEVPDMNVVWTTDALRRFSSVDIGVAMATERGLMTPVLRSVQTRSLSDISAGIRDLAGRAAAGTLKQHELEGGSFAVSNLGMFDVEEFTAIINPPHAGILAVGSIAARAVEGEGGHVEFAKQLTVVLSVDHRSVDGALAAQWLQKFKQLIENPFRLLV